MNNYDKKLSGASKKPNAKIIIAIAVAAVVLLNVAVQLLPDTLRRFDITSSDSYTLSDSTKKYFSELDEKITLYVLDADGSDMKYEYLLKRVDASSENIDVKWTSLEEVGELAESMGITEDVVTPYLIIAESEKRSTVVALSDLVAYHTENSTLTSFFGTGDLSLLEYEYYKQVLAEQAQSSTEYAEQYASMLEALLYDVETYFYAEPYLCRIVEYLTVDIIPARYTLTGHGETVLDETEIGYYLSDTVGMIHNTLNTADGAAIPEDAVSIIVLNPTSDFTKAEADMFISYLNGGGQMSFFTSDENLDMPNLMSVINAYGLSAQKGTVSETVTVEKEESDGAAGGDEATSAEGDTAEYGEGNITEPGTYVTDTVGVHINTDHKAMSELDGMSVSPVITKGNSILFTNADGLALTPLLTTSEGAFIGEDTEQTRGAKALAAVSEKTDGGTLLWFTGAESFTTPILESEDDTEEMTRIYSNCALVISSLALAPYTYESTVTIPAASYYGERLMTVNETSFVVFVIVIVVAVVTLSVAGVIIWYKRKKA